jgi:hypothetical protein
MVSTSTLLRFKDTLIRRRSSGDDACVETYAEKYYNRKDVQRAVHANTTGIPYRWTACRFQQFSLSCDIFSTFFIQPYVVEVILKLLCIS